MSLKDIEKLKEKVDKDPNSKLFVPLAEEYRKEGMLDEAISVLLNGVEKQPGYMSARVSLGKIYLEKEMLPEALAEFEQVIKSIPDNLYAHKKLAEIYRATGHTDQAIRAYKTVLKLNTMDEEALISLSELEGMESGGAVSAAAVTPQAPEQEAAVLESHSHAEEEVPAVGFVAEDEKAAVPVKEEDLAAFQSAIFGSAAEEEVASPADLLASADMPFGTEEEIPEAEAAEEESSEGFALDEALEIPDISPEVSFEESIREDISSRQEEPQSVPAAPAAVTIADADRHISEGAYGDAMKIFRTLLEANPEDRQVLQRVEELRQFLKMIGKDKEALVSQLNSFLDGIEKRRDEFLRHP
ncbi:MAG: tetratricopeptide repeat protein [Nitrospiraceae bacterium]|nr:tetratricopeptide repeat protein [Nitrospiraceae bacterium]